MSNIEWTDETWNPCVGCTPVSPGCLNCYAATMAPRLESMGQKNYVGLTVKRDGRSVFNGTVRCLPDRLGIPLGWRTPRMVFVNSMSDLFHEDMPVDFIARVFGVMFRCPQHTFQILTKRSDRMAKVTSDPYFYQRIHEAIKGDMGYDHPGRPAVNQSDLPLKNVWLGTSCEDQKHADLRIPHLLRCPAAVRFLSCEPLLGPIDIRWDAAYERRADALTPRDGIGWLIVGGESGPRARPCNVEWIRSIVKQCADAGVPCFVKQLGSNVQCRNDCVSDWLDECGLSLEWIQSDHVRMQGDPVRVMLNRKGSDPAQWPEKLRVRQMPKEPTHV